MRIRHAAAFVPVLGLLALAAGCGGGDDGGETAGTGSALFGRIEADGSSTVGPFTALLKKDSFAKAHGRFMLADAEELATGHRLPSSTPRRRPQR